MTARLFYLLSFMATHKLKNYVRTYRKRMGLSQNEVAYLLGCRSGAKVSRYERFEREPGLETALACEVIFHVSVRELFAGLFEEVERKTFRRMVSLAEKLNSSDSGRPSDLRRKALIAAVLESHLSDAHRHE